MSGDRFYTWKYKQYLCFDNPAQFARPRVRADSDETAPDLGGFGMSSETKPREKRSPESGAQSGPSRLASAQDNPQGDPQGDPLGDPQPDPQGDPLGDPQGESAKGASDGGGRNPPLRAWFHYAAYAVIAFALVQLDPLHWNEAASEASQDLAYRVLIGPLYPTDHRDDITVVLFNEATLKYLGATWPTALGVHAEVLKTIRAMEPKAVMVDFIFPDSRRDPTVVELQEAIRAFEEPAPKPIPLYFARAEGANLDWIRPDLLEATLTGAVIPVSDGVSRTYQPCSVLGGDDPGCACVADFNEFAACPAGTDAASPDTPVALTAAFAMFDRGGLPDWFDVQRPAMMDVVWSNRLNPINAEWMRKQVGSELEALCIDLNTGIVDWVHRLVFTSENYSFRQPCPYATTVTAHALLQASQDPRLREIIRGKYVFYGGDLTGLEDTVVPPTHVKLPGVFLHAMALDNLLTFGGQYKHSSFPTLGLGLSAKDFNLALAILIALIAVAFVRNESVFEVDPQKAREATGLAYVGVVLRRLAPWLCFNLIMLAIIVALCSALYFAAAVSPKNWLGYWGLSVALSGMAKGRFVEPFAAVLGERLIPSLKPLIFEEKRT